LYISERPPPRNSLAATSLTFNAFEYLSHSPRTPKIPRFTLERTKTPEEREADSIIPCRTVSGVSLHPIWSPLSEETRKLVKTETISTSLFWVDGKRTLLQVENLVELETGKCDLRALIEQFKILERYAYVKLSRLR